MKKLWIIGAIVASVTAGVVATQAHTHAAGRIGLESSNYIKSGETVDSSVFLAGDAVTVEGTVKGDVYCAAKTIVIAGTVDGDIICAGAEMTLSGSARNVRAAGQNVRIKGEYSGNVTIFGQYIDLEASSKIGGDLAGGAQTFNAAGKIGRDVTVSSGTFALSGAVGRDISGEYEQLRISKEATVSGAVRYASEKDGVVEGNVSGGVTRTEPNAGQSRSRDIAGEVLFALALIIGSALTVMVVAWLAPRKLRTLTTLEGKDTLIASATGVLVVFMGPIVLLMIALTIVGLPIALLAGVVWMALIAMSGSVVAYALGRRMSRRWRLSPVIASGVGGAVLMTLCMVPLLGLLLAVGIVVYGVGMQVYALRLERR